MKIRAKLQQLRKSSTRNQASIEKFLSGSRKRPYSGRSEKTYRNRSKPDKSKE